MSLAAFDKRVGYYDGNQKSMAVLGSDEDIDMEDVAAGDEEDEYFPQESQVPSDDIYVMPPPGQCSGDYEFDFDRPLQLASPQHRPEGCLHVYPLIFYSSACTDVDEEVVFEEEDTAQCTLHGEQGVDQQNGV
jgi:hypothetical protein